jgi:hypothetical protein
VTVLAAVGLGLAWLAWSAEADGRALLIALAVCLLLSFGPATFGSLIKVIPGSADLFFRRFMMGVQLAALLLAGRGAAWLAAGAARQLKTRVSRWPPRLTPAGVFIAAIVALAPAWLQLGAYDRHDGAEIAAQQHADSTQGAQLERLIAVIKNDGGGRTYAGMPSNWGQTFTVGAVPVFKYLDSRDVDEVGYTLRTASLMTDPEDYFDDRNPSDYRLFAVLHLILPSGSRPSIPARLTLRVGPYSLWTLPGPNDVLRAGTIVGTLPADRSDIATRTLPVLHSRLAQAGDYLRVAYGQHGARGLRLAQPSSAAPAGTVLAQSDELQQGLARASVRMRKPGIVVLSASFDPGWTATVDGRRRRTEMVAPALVATTVPAGTHRIVFRYRGWKDYPLLFAIGAAALIALACSLRRRQTDRLRNPSTASGFTNGA